MSDTAYLKSDGEALSEAIKAEAMMQTLQAALDSLGKRSLKQHLPILLRRQGEIRGSLGLQPTNGETPRRTILWASCMLPIGKTKGTWARAVSLWEMISNREGGARNKAWLIRLWLKEMCAQTRAAVVESPVWLHHYCLGMERKEKMSPCPLTSVSLKSYAVSSVPL